MLRPAKSGIGANDYLKLIRGHDNLAHSRWKHRMHIDDNPFCIKFTSHNKTLHFIGVYHGNPPSASCDLIEQVLVSSRPDLIIIEGVRAGKINPTGAKGEVGYTVSIAKCNCIGVEPSMRDIYIKLRANPYDIILFEMLKDYIQHQRSHASFDIPLRAEHYKRLVREATDADIDRFDFYSQYKHVYDISFDNPSSFSLTPCPTGNPVEQIMYNVGIIRDKLIFENTRELLNHYSNIVMIYGHSHFYAQRLALERLFDKHMLLCAKCIN